VKKNKQNLRSPNDDLDSGDEVLSDDEIAPWLDHLLLDEAELELAIKWQLRKMADAEAAELAGGSVGAASSSGELE
jgi:hypothetical protein